MSRGGLEKLAAAATATTAAAVASAVSAAATAAVVVVDEEQNDDDEQDPGAVIPTEEVSQAHILSPPFLAYTPYYVAAGEGVPFSLPRIFPGRGA